MRDVFLSMTGSSKQRSSSGRGVEDYRALGPLFNSPHSICKCGRLHVSVLTASAYHLSKWPRPIPRDLKSRNPRSIANPDLSEGLLFSHATRHCRLC